jgi:hypothetical protein
MEDKNELIKKIIGQKNDLENKLIEQITVSPTGKQTFLSFPPEMQKSLLAKMTVEQRAKLITPLDAKGGI